MKRNWAIANGVFAAAFLLAPAAIFACPAGSNNGIVAVDSSAVGSVKEADQPLTSDADTTYVHGFNVLDAEGTFSVVDGGKTLSTGAWKGTRSKTGNGFDFTAGPLQVPEGAHTVKVFDTSGLSDKEASKTFTAHKKPVAPTTKVEDKKAPATVPTTVPTTAPVGKPATSPADSEAGTIKLHPIGPCPDANAEQLNHGAPNCDATGVEPADEATQNAEIGKVENVTPRMIPHLPCENIEVLGSGMADGTSNYQIEAHPPTAKFIPVYGRNADGTSVLTGDMTPGDVGNNGAAVYNRALGGLQVMDVVDVDALIHNAQVAGGQEHAIQGYHFKINLTQGAEAGKSNGSKSGKQKVFWIDCPAPVQPPVVTPPPGPQPGPCTTVARSLESYSYSINGGAPVSALENNVHQGDKVTVTYTTAGSCANQTFSLVSYTAPSAAFDRATASQQQVFNFDTQTVAAGTHTLSVNVPGCFFQVDFVKGAPIFHLGATDNDFYGAQNRLIDAENGGTDSCKSVTPPPPAPILAIVKHVDHTQVVAPAPLTYTIDVTNSGNGAATNIGIVDAITPGTVAFDAPSHFFPSSGAVAASGGHYIWTIPSIAPGGSAELTFTILAKSAGSIANAASIGAPAETCAAPTCSQVQTTVTVPPAPGTITAVIYKQGTTTVVPGGTVQLQGATAATGNYPATYRHLPAANYCVQEVTPMGYSLTGATVSGAATSMATPGQVCFPLSSGQTIPVVYFVSHDTPQTPPTACVGEEYMLQGTHIVVPGGTVNLNGGNTQTAPFTYCNLPLGSATGSPVAPPTGYTLVPGTTAITETLAQGNNPTMIFFVNIPQPTAECGNVLGTIVLAGTTTMVPGGTITESGQPAVTTYPALLGPCSPATTGVGISMTPPPGYQVVGADHTTAPITSGQVTPVIFQVRPVAGNGGTPGTGGTPNPTTGTQPVSGVQAASVQHAPTSGVLGTSIGMPLTGSEAQGRIALSLVCVALGMMALVMNRRASRQ